MIKLAPRRAAPPPPENITRRRRRQKLISAPPPPPPNVNTRFAAADQISSAWGLVQLTSLFQIMLQYMLNVSKDAFEDSVLYVVGNG